MPEHLSFGNLAVVMAVAFMAPLLLGLAPRVRLPAVVLEIVLGIIIGPDVLGWAEADEPVQILAVVGLAFLLFLAGLELDLDHLRGRPLRLAGAGFLLSLALALVAGYALDAAGLVASPLLAAVILSSTSLGLVIPVLKEAKENTTALGQLVLAGASIADFAAVILLSLLFSRDATGTGAKVVLLVGFGMLVVGLAVALTRHAPTMPIGRVLTRLQDTTAQIRVRGAMLLLILLVAAAERFGLETILGAFVAGAVLGAIDRDPLGTHPLFRVKLEAIGYGFLVPVFFVTSGIRFDLSALLDEPTTLLRVPLFLAALLVARGLPALTLRSVTGTRGAVAAGLLQATSLPFIVAATEIGIALDLITPVNAAAFVAAGLVSALVFPTAALALLRRPSRQPAPSTAPASGSP